MDGGYNADDAKAFIGAYQDNFFNYPIFQTYMRIPGTTEMMTAMGRASVRGGHRPDLRPGGAGPHLRGLERASSTTAARMIC